MGIGTTSGEEQQDPPLQLRDGRTIRFRPMTIADAEGLRRFHEGLSGRTIYQRYFAAHPHLSRGDLEYLTSVDHDRREALVALDADRIVGVGRFDAIGDDEAEVAFVVADSCQGQGVGSRLLQGLIPRAMSRGIRALVAETLPGNGAMVRVLTRCGFAHTQTHGDGVVQVRIDLTQPRVDPPHGDAPALR